MLVPVHNLEQHCNLCLKEVDPLHNFCFNCGHEIDKVALMCPLCHKRFGSYSRPVFVSTHDQCISCHNTWEHIQQKNKVSNLSAFTFMLVLLVLLNFLAALAALLVVLLLVNIVSLF